MADSLIELRRNIRKAIRDSAPVGTCATEVGDIFEAVMEVVRSEKSAEEVRESEKQQSAGSIQASDQWTDERYS